MENDKYIITATTTIQNKGTETVYYTGYFFEDYCFGLNNDRAKVMTPDEANDVFSGLNAAPELGKYTKIFSNNEKSEFTGQTRDGRKIRKTYSIVKLVS